MRSPALQSCPSPPLRYDTTPFSIGNTWDPVAPGGIAQSSSSRSQIRKKGISLPSVRTRPPR